jgi:hypothetical protein
MSERMSTRFDCNARFTMDSEAYVGDHPTQEISYGSLNEIVCFGEVMYHFNNENHNLLMLQTFERRSSESLANVVVVL